MKVYRLEHRGWGVFCKYLYTTPSDALYTEYGFQCGKQYQWNDDYRSGCESLDKLIEYFGSDFALITGTEGVELVEYTIHKAHVRFGLNANINIEVAFKADKVTHREVIATWWKM